MTSICQWILRYDSKITSNNKKKYTGQTSSKLKKKILYFKGHYKESEKNPQNGRKIFVNCIKIEQDPAGPSWVQVPLFPLFLVCRKRL